jgi:secreted PhoX family phosphatase
MQNMDANRRSFLVSGVAAGVALGLGLGTFKRAFAAAPRTPGRYGPLGMPDTNGVRLPAGFSARLVARTGDVVAGTAYQWHGEPDGGATFVTPDRGWVYVSNSELNGSAGGAGAVKFDRNGNIVDAYRILGGTKWNCAGGATPWGKWLSCEEFRSGQVWECDPFGSSQGIARPALGRFPHEAAVVDPVTGRVYLTEDDYGSRLYRFTPERWGDLRSGRLEAARIDGVQVRWVPVPADRPYRGRDTSPFERGEGAWFSGRVLYFATTADHRVWAHDVDAGTIEIIYDAATYGSDAPLYDPDNVTVHERTGDIYVAEDADDLQLVLLADGDGRRIAEPFLQLIGHAGSEVAGPAFSPDGSRLYFTSQRGIDGKRGMTFEVSGPFS